ncbi:MAG: ATP-binding protein [Negativicutes bacterium]|nr:ATP-binding protein [Negativicutes bacterium]
MKQLWELFGSSLARYLDEDELTPIFGLDPEDRIKYCNRAFKNLLDRDGSPAGLDIGQLFGADAAAVLKAPDSRESRKLFWQIPTARGLLRFECQVYCQGDLRLIIARKPMMAEDEIIAKMSSINLEMANMARTLEKENAAAQIVNRQLRAEIAETMAQAERLSALAAMAAGMAHEIAQPLTSIKAIADMTVLWHRRDQSVLPGDVIADMEEISRQAENIDTIIRHMRSLVAKNRMDLRTCDLNQSVRDVLGYIQAKATKADICLRASFGQGLPPVTGNAVGIAEIVTNLTANAITALSKVDSPDKTITVQTTRSGEGAVLEISDNGPGIDAAIRDRIFEPFFTTDRTENGMGLGLSLVQAIVAAHNGQITAGPNHPRGAVFRILFPTAGFLSGAAAAEESEYFRPDKI